MDIKTFLKGLPAFARFQDRHIDVLVSNLELRDFAAGQVLVKQGEQGPAAYILVNASVHVSRRDPIKDADEDIGEARDGEVIGLLSLVDNMPAPETCTANGSVLLAALTPERFHALFLLAPPIGHQLQYMVAVQLARDLQEKNKLLRRSLALKKTPGSFLERLLGVSSG